MPAARLRLLTLCGLVLGLSFALMPPRPAPGPVPLASVTPPKAPAPEPASPLPAGAVRRIGESGFRHVPGYEITSLAVSADGRTVYTVDHYTAHAWDLRSGRMKWRL